ncbi:MAG TPA: bifunctional ADP-heptose synthase [Edaphocola sp.]|nr:bifunctional ADP-heptose synthase [Edaphocola sp.]
MKTSEIFDSFGQMKVLVVGDVMLDVYLHGEAERISPEAPVPVVRIQGKDVRAGGAANVALNCKALGAQVAIASVTGNDGDGRALINILQDNGLDTTLIQTCGSRKTTTKTRIISRNQQMIRFDSEEDTDISLQEEHALIDAVLKYLQIQKPDVLIFEDYNKGLLKENVIRQIIRHCRVLKIPTVVDPKKKNFFAYQGVDVFKPNLKEVKEGLNITLTAIDPEQLNQVHMQLYRQLKHRVSFITLSELGVFYNDGQYAEILPSHRRNIADVSGAGDTVIAVAGMVYAQTKNAAKMASWANLAGGLVCEEAGVVPINKARLLREIEKSF